VTKGAIIDLSSTPIPDTGIVDFLVIGSGSGGATAARLLAEAGRDVVVLEEGGDFRGAKLTQRDGAMYDQLYMDRGGRSTDDLSIAVLQGRVLGGGGVINASDVVPIDDPVLGLWQKRFGLTEFTPSALEPHRAATLIDLRANRIDDSQLNRNNLILREGATKLALAGEVMHHNRVGCVGLGTCLIGCPLDAKQSPRIVAVPLAVERGARFFVRTRAVRIDDANAEVKRVTVRTLDEKGYREQHEHVIRARHVIVAANPINSVQLLLRSGLGNAHVGRHLSLQPQLPIVARFDDDVVGFRGIPQAYAVTAGEHFDDDKGIWGYRIEAIMGTPGIVSSMLPFVGAHLKQAMTEYRRYASALLLMPDEPSGTISVSSSGRPKIAYTHLENHKARARDAIRTAARAYLAAGAQSIMVPLAKTLTITRESDLAFVDDLDFATCTAPWISAHQQGGVRFAPSANDGAADPDGRVYGTRDVFVFDSSGFPTSASTHTMAPIMSVARFLTSRLLARA
jgi:choline dehydrogenase-like flavoprotein